MLFADMVILVKMVINDLETQRKLKNMFSVHGIYTHPEVLMIQL